MAENNLDKLLKELNDSVGKFNSSLSIIESGILAEVELLLRDIKLSNGNIVQDVENLKKINRLKETIDKVVINPQYKQRVVDFGKAFNTVEKIQSQYFSEMISNYSAPNVLKQIKQTAIEDTVLSLTETGIRANVSEKVGAILKTGVESGARYNDMVKELRTFITGDSETPGALERYASQITTDGINQFAATYNKIVTDDLGLKWYTYVGSLVGDSRELCEKLVSKKYIHESELSQIVKGKIDGVQIPVYKKTGLPYGMIAGTTKDNFQVRRGGYRCNHLLMPVVAERVPIEIRKKFEKTLKETVAA